MRSVTSTTQRTINYGAVLQCYALHKTQRDRGVENYVLDRFPPKALYLEIRKKTYKTTVVNTIANGMFFLHRKRSKRCLDRFNRFVKEYIITTKQYRDIDELRRNPPFADFYINGSDQVFGLRGEFDKERMLQFGEKTVKRYSFSASLGEYDWTAEEKTQFAKMLEGFSMISVREKYAKEYLESFANVTCEVHVDPVFLLTKEEWSAIAADRIIKEDYILCYPLIGNANTQAVVNGLKKKTGLKTVCIQIFPIKRVRADKYIFDAGPEEFLSLFKYAKYIVTTSFHGTVFSILFEKPFYTLIKNYKSQRMTELLDKLELSERIYSKNTVVDDGAVDFAECRAIVNRERQRGLDYLNKIIDDVRKEVQEE